MKRHLNTLFLTFCILVAFILYFATGASVAMPGASAQFLAAVVYPGDLAYQPQYAFDAWVTHLCVSCCGSGFLGGMRLITALVGAGIVGFLLRSVQLMMMYAVRTDVNLEGIDHEVATFDYSLMKRLVTILLAPLAIVAFPLWVMGTRPLEGHVTVLLVTMLLWLSLGLRLAYVELVEHEKEIVPSWISVRLGLFAFLFAMLFFLSPQLLPVLLLPFLFVGRIFLLVSISLAQRARQLVWVGVGFLFGLLVALLFFIKGWQPLFLPFVETSPTTLFFLSFWSALRGLPAILQSFETVAAWTFYILNAVLFLGSFPRAFYKALTPFIGQLSIVALWAFLFASYPQSFWMSMVEPDPIAASGMVLLVLNTALLVASWVRNWLDGNVEKTARQKMVYTTLLTAIPATICVGCALVFHAKDASCLLANRALRETWPHLATVLPKTAKPWLVPPPEAERVMLQRYAEGIALTPISQPTRQLEMLSLKGKTWAEAAQADVLLTMLATLGDAPLMQYLAHSQWAEGFFIGDPFSHYHEGMVVWAEALEATAFAQTTLGQRMVQSAYRKAAIYLANAALEMSPETAVNALRTAAQYDLENKGVALSIASLAHAGVFITEEEHNRAITIYNEEPYLEHPTLSELASFEARYGAVRTPAFETAHRLAHFNAGVVTERCLENLIHIYKTQPTALALEERLYALLHLSEAEAFALLQRDDTRLDPREEECFFRELEGFLLFFIQTPSAQALYETHRHRFSNPKTSYLSRLYRFEVGSSSFNQQSENIEAFYHRDKHLAYALYYVRHLLETGQLLAATDFLTAFDVQEALAKQPLFNQYLLSMLVDAWQKEDPEKAASLLAARLSSNPKQPLLWSRYLPLVKDNALRQKAIADCLSLYPMHPEATHAFAASCALTHGEAVAQRYLESVKKAQQTNIRMAPHAHR